MEEDNQNLIKDLTEEEKKDLEEFFKKIEEEVYYDWEGMR